jgi:hypothetical protein
MKLKFITVLTSAEILSNDVITNIKSGKCQKFENPISYECKCENRQSFQAVITEDCDIDFYRTHFCNYENMVCNSIEQMDSN